MLTPTVPLALKMKLAILMGLINWAVSGSVDYEDCGSTVKVTDLRISGCLSQPCVFYKGKEYVIEFDAIAGKPSTALPYSVKAQFFFPLTILEGDACEELTKGTCPMTQQGTLMTFSRHFTIEPPFPTPASMSTKITAEVEDDGGNRLICARLAVQIKKNPNPTVLLEANPTSPPTRSPAKPFSYFNFFRSIVSESEPSVEDVR